MSKLKKVTADVHLEIWLDCPYCEGYQNRFSELHEFLGDDLRAEEIDEEITCEDCGKKFIVESIDY